jgi:ABC-type proline/glycine betaine transport system permease subunit
MSLVGAGGLGDLIFTGIAMVDAGLMLAGAVPTACLAIFELGLREAEPGHITGHPAGE